LGALVVKILVLNYEYPPVGGGGGRICARVAAKLVRRGHEVRVVTSGMKGLPQCAEEGGVLVLRPRTFRRRADTCTVAEMGLYVACAAWESLRQAHIWKPDVVHAHFIVPSGALAFFLRGVSGVPYVLTAHLGDVPGGVPEQTAGLFRLVAPAARMIWRGAAGNVAVSSHVAGLCAKAFGTSGTIIPNGIEAMHPPERSPHGTPPHILWLGRMSIQKNPVLAVESMRQVAELPWTMEFIGDGPLESATREAAAQAGLSDRIRFAGWREAGCVRAAMERADILLMTSLHEGLPMAAVEALWHGMAIVATRIPGTADVVDGNGGRAELDAEAFAAELRPLLSDPRALARAQAASFKLAARFDLEQCTAAYESVLREASLKKTPRPPGVQRR
jgi:glycosyltransferase involved in cell wall biosynthesis